MIKRILVALDPDSDSRVATQYAVRIAQQTDARITGLAVVDTRNIEASSRGGGIGSMYYAEKLRENLTQETRDQARALIAQFESHVEGCDVRHIETVEEGVPFERIVEDMKYHDLLVVGCDPHFFYGHPKKRTNTLAGVFHHTVGPTIVVPKVHREVKKVLFATNGENSASRAIRRFVELEPFGSDLDVEVMIVYEKDEQVDAEFHLQLTKDYLSDHGYKAHVTGMQDSHRGDRILERAADLDVDLIVAGSTTSKGLTGYHMSKTTQQLTDNETIAVFVEH
jgi:nucleotide-binding universal stress UspA family protein